LDIQEKIDLYFSYWSSDSGIVQELNSHIQYRQTHPDVPPLIILSATQYATPTLLPTQPPVAILTPDAAQVEHWQEYQMELAKAILPMLPVETVLCEWDILASSGQELYVWAVCASPSGSDWRPAIIHSGTSGSFQGVEVPKRGSGDTDKLFPEAARVKFSLYTGDSIFSGRLREMLDHIDYREIHPEEPPLIILSAMQNATPTP